MPRKPPATASVPVFALYGDGGDASADMLHIESLRSRGGLYEWEIGHHTHRALHQLVWLQAGAVELWLDDDHRHATGPLVVVVPPGAVHGFRFGPEPDGQVLTLSPRVLLEGDVAAAGQAIGAAGQAFGALFAQPRLLVPADDGEPARWSALFDALAAEFNAPGSAGSPVPLWLARALVWRLAQRAQRDALAAGSVDGAAARGQQALFTRFLVLLEAHHTDHWPVARYADRLGLSAERLNRLVRAESGRSTLALIHERLLREACRRVAYVPAPIASLAFGLGFDDPAYFCRFFKRHLGQSPSQYRQRAAAG